MASHRYYQGAATPCRSPAALRCLRLAVPSMRLALLLPSPAQAHGATGLGLFGSGRPAPDSPSTETTGAPKFLENPYCTFAGLFDPGRTSGVRPLLRRPGAAPVAGTSRAPALRLSRLNPPALVLAVYASPRRSPAQDARLASGCWSGSAGRARSAGFHREVSECSTSHPPLPSLLGAIPHSGQRSGVARRS